MSDMRRVRVHVSQMLEISVVRDVDFEEIRAWLIENASTQEITAEVITEFLKADVEPFEIDGDELNDKRTEVDPSGFDIDYVSW